MSQNRLHLFSNNKNTFSDIFRESQSGNFKINSSASPENIEDINSLSAVLIDFPGFETDSVERLIQDLDDSGTPVFFLTDGGRVPDIETPGNYPEKFPVLNPPLEIDEFKLLIDRESRLLDQRSQLRRVRDLYAEECRYREILSDIIQTANSSLELDRVLQLVMNRIKNLIKAEGWSLILLSEDEEELIFKRAEGIKEDEIEETRMEAGSGLAGWAVENREAAVINNPYEDERFSPSIDYLAGFKTRSLLCVPLISRNKILGVVEIINKKGDEGFSTAEKNILKTLVKPAAIAIDNAQLFEETKELSIKDEITDLYNSRYFSEKLTQEVERARRYDSRISLIFMDIDDFKVVNDSYGHMVGSNTLTEVGGIIKNTIRDIDIGIRYGGDEFIVILPNTGLEGSKTLAERIRKRVEKHVFYTGEENEFSITISCGIATFPDTAEDEESIIRKADQAMYYVKEHGKNAVKPTGERQE